MAALSREQIVAEALTILTALRDNTRDGRSNKLADVKSTFEQSFSLDFDTYFFFLRKHHFINMDREACLSLTGEGERLLEGERRERFTQAVGDYFAERISKALAAAEAEPAPRTVVDGRAAEEGQGSPSPASAEAIEDETTSRHASLNARTARSRSGHEVAAAPAAAPARASAAPAAPAGTAVEGADLRYVKYDPVGQGPLGTVYRGRHSALGLDVAVKELKDIFSYFSFLQRGEVTKRLKREICAQAVVRHPCVVQILDHACEVARPFFVTELCGGGNLRQRLDAAGGKGLPVEEALRSFLQICYGLAAAHELGLAHGNLKPENVLFDHLGNAKLADFGMGRVVEVDSSKGMPQVIVGTGGMGYMSPEQISKGKEQGSASDVYAAGILLYEMLTGQLPGRRSPLPSAANKNVPAKIDAIFDKMTQDRREERYPDFDGVLGDFYAAFENGAWLKRGDLVLSSPAPLRGKAK